MTSTRTPAPATPVTELHAAVGRYYDDTVDLYEELWGEHIHHGYWAEGEGSEVDRHTAQLRTVAELAAFAGLPRESTVLDAGCGVGGPALYLASELGCHVDGITLSPRQVERATAKAQEVGVADRARFRVLDALHTDLPDAAVDVVWALESLELMGDKEAFFAEAWRVLRPGGTLAVTTWCVHPGDLPAKDAALLRRIYAAYELPYILPLEQYEQMCQQTGFEQVRVADWSARVRQTYDTGVTLVRRLEGEKGYLKELARRQGVGILRFFQAIPLMKQAYDIDLLRYGAIRATKPRGHDAHPTPTGANP